MPSVCIITTCFKDLDGLKKTADSVLEQTFPLTWIVTDADSGDDHRMYLESIKSEFHVIRWSSLKDRGLYDGMNRGFLESSEDILLFLNAGDTLATENVIETIVNSYLEENWNWCVGLAVRISESGTPRAVWEYLNPELGGLAIGTRTFCHQATFYKRDFLKMQMPYKIDNLAADHLVNVALFKAAAPKMLPLVTTIFQDGGVSSKRPFRAAMKDLRAVRKETNLLIGNSDTIDLIVSDVVVFLVNLGGVLWNILRKIGHRLIKEPNRVTP
jgi:glycosyltransferase involved in cell wall biosynthesis